MTDTILNAIKWAKESSTRSVKIEARDCNDPSIYISFYDAGEYAGAFIDDDFDGDFDGIIAAKLEERERKEYDRLKAKFEAEQAA